VWFEVPSTEPGQDIYVHQAEPGINDTPYREGPSCRSDLRLISVGYISSAAVKWTLKAKKRKKMYI